MAAKTKKTTKLVKVYYGASYLSEESIFRDGLLPQRRSGDLYVTGPNKAFAYARAWAVGLHAVGIADRPEAVVFECRVPEETPHSGNQLTELALHIPKIDSKRIKVVRREMVVNITEAERAALLANFFGVVGWKEDPYPRKSPWHGLKAKAQALLDPYTPDQILEGLETVGWL